MPPTVDPKMTPTMDPKVTATMDPKVTPTVDSSDETGPLTPEKSTSGATGCGPSTPSGLSHSGTIMRETIVISSEKKTLVLKAASGANAGSSEEALSKRALEF